MMDDVNLWCVVVFNDDNSVATIPQSWLSETMDGADMAFWPPNTKHDTNLVKRREHPSNSWSQYPVKILGTYDNYDIALKKSKTTQETSDLSSAKTKMRNRKLNKRYIHMSSSSEARDIISTTHKKKRPSKNQRTSSSEESSSETKENFPEFPKQVIHQSPTFRDRIKELDVTSKTNSPVSLSANSTPSRQTGFGTPRSSMANEILVPRHEAFGTPRSSGTTNEVPPATQQGFGTPRSSISINEVKRSMGQGLTMTQMLGSDTDFKRQVLTKLNIINAELSNHDENFEILLRLLDEKRTNTCDDAEINLTLTNLLPIDSDEDLTALEELVQDQENSRNLARELSRIGSNSVNLAKKIMYFVVSNELGQLYSWEGGKGKRKFINLILTKVIFDAVRRNQRTKDACEDEIISVIKKWLVKAK